MEDSTFAPSDFATITEVATVQVPDFQLSPFEALVGLRVASILDGSPLGLDVLASERDAQLYAVVRAAVDIAYRLGLKDGQVRLGELV